MRGAYLLNHFYVEIKTKVIVHKKFMIIVLEFDLTTLTLY